MKLTHCFVEFLPDDMDQDVLYISIPYATVEHKCCCGCGERATTPLSPTDWSLTFDGKSVSLYPSIGNWSFPCRSHYWIRGNEVVWAAPRSQGQIEANRARDRIEREAYFRQAFESGSGPTPQTPAAGRRGLRHGAAALVRRIFGRQ